MQEMQIRSLSQEDTLEKEMATHSSISAWESPWTEETSGLQSTGLQRVSYNLAARKQQQVLKHFCPSVYLWWKLFTILGYAQCHNM